MARPFFSKTPTPRLPEPLAVIETVRLVLGHRFADPPVDDPIRQDLSAVALWGESLFLSSDEQAGIERLVPTGERAWGDHVQIPFHGIFDLPGPEDEEMDIEGLAADDGFLWAVGSHSSKRRKPDGRSGPAGLRRMARIRRDSNRYFLGRAPLREVAPGVFEPVAAEGARRARMVKTTGRGNKLMKWLKDDPLLGPFLELPSKENGFDIEGLAVRGERVWLGLRGPVLRGHAVIVELSVKESGEGALKARRIDGERRYRLHLVPSMGLGVRDLKLWGEDLVVLLGPATSVSGLACLLIWRGAVHAAEGGVVADAEVDGPVRIVAGWGGDHPEGIVRWPARGEDAFLVVYDGPLSDRLYGDGVSIDADVLRLAAPLERAPAAG